MKGHIFTSLGLMIMPIFLLGCLTINQQSKVKIQQGIQGQIFELKGNLMPQKGKPLPVGIGFASQIYIFEPTTLQSAVQVSGQIFQMPETKLIASFATDSLGKFKVQLKPGKYSVFVSYQNGYYAASFNQLNELGIVEVLSGTFAHLEVIISAKASY
jgi:hypothetical protein